MLIERVIDELKDKGEEFDIEGIIDAVMKDDRSKQETKDAVENRFIATKHWGLFSKEGTPFNDLVKGGQVTVLDVGCYATIPGTQGLRALVIGLVAEKLFVQRMIARKNEEVRIINETTHFVGQKTELKQKEPLVWLAVDEAHEFLPREGDTPASQPLITILREGRQPGISLVLATQQPGMIHHDVITQTDIVLSHRLTAKTDIEALNSMMQSYMLTGITQYMNELPRDKGSAIILDDTSERIYPLKVRPRISWHGGEAPTALKQRRKLDLS